MNKGRITESNSTDVDIVKRITDLQQEETYRYPGISEGNGIHLTQMKEMVRRAYYRRVHLVLNIDLKLKEKVYKP